MQWLYSIARYTFLWKTKVTLYLMRVVHLRILLSITNTDIIREKSPNWLKSLKFALITMAQSVWKQVHTVFLPSAQCTLGLTPAIGHGCDLTMQYNENRCLLSLWKGPTLPSFTPLSHGLAIKVKRPAWSGHCPEGSRENSFGSVPLKCEIDPSSLYLLYSLLKMCWIVFDCPQGNMDSLM